jgi:hypothetical protein
VRVRAGRVPEERGDVDGVGGEVPEVEGVEVECWGMLLLAWFWFWFNGWR